MYETLFSGNIVDLVLAFLGLGLALFFPYLTGQKIRIRELPRPVQQLTFILLFWNALSVIGHLFFSGSDPSTLGIIVFALQGIAWIQLGHATHHICAHAFKISPSKSWRTLHIVSFISLIALTVFFCVDLKDAQDFFAINFLGINTHPLFFAYSILFFVFVVPEMVLTCYYLLKGALQTNDSSITQINTYMLGSYAFFAIFGFLFDFVFPFAYRFSGPFANVCFLHWVQYCTVMITIICAQYFTSVSFKNKSAWYFLTEFVNQIGDSILFYNNKGKVSFANDNFLHLMQIPNSDLSKIQPQELFKEIDLYQEATHNNVKVQINNELHTFNIGVYFIKQTLTTHINVLLLCDQTNLLFYKQRIEVLNRQYSEYKQDLFRYQERLKLSEKKAKESGNVNETLINALPFQVWSKNENGVYQTQNQKDLDKRGNMTQLTDPPQSISENEKKARQTGDNSTFISYEDENHKQISENDATIKIQNDEKIFIYQNHFIHIMADNPPYKVIGLKIDVSEEHKLERERNKLREQINIHSRLEELGTICGAFAHDYNNILGSQIGFCDLAMEVLDGALANIENERLQKQILLAKAQVIEAQKAAKNGKESLNVLLDTIRGKTESSIKDTLFRPTEIIRDLVKKLVITLPQNIKIKFGNMDESLRIKAQAPSLDRILSNMSNNAIYAMKAKGGTLTFDVQREVFLQQQISSRWNSEPIPPGEYVRISISDTGTGMDSGTLQRIFAPFFTTKSPGDGLGLGLSSALRLLKEGNAYFDVDTTVGEGTTFNLYWNMYKDKKTKEE